MTSVTLAMPGMRAIVMFMEIYVLRHGIAAAAGRGEKDSDRALTAEGKQKLGHVLARAHAAGVKPAVILTSPLRRAIETARIAAEQLGYSGEIVQTPALIPSSSPEELWSEIQAHRAESVLLAGHEPLLGEFLTWILGSPFLCVNFKKGALARVDAEPTSGRPKGVLQWFITPKLAAG